MNIPTLVKEEIPIKFFGELSSKTIYSTVNKFIFTYSCLTNFL